MVDFYTERTVKWADREVILIDQTKLPTRLHYVKCKTPLQVADAIRHMVVRGAPAIGVAAAMGLALAAHNSKSNERRKLMAELEEAGRILASTRPTAVNLTWAIRRVLDSAKKAEGGRERIVETVVKEAVRMADEDVEHNRALGKHGASLIRNGDAILTHCNWLQ